MPKGAAVLLVPIMWSIIIGIFWSIWRSEFVGLLRERLEWVDLLVLLLLAILTTAALMGATAATVAILYWGGYYSD